ncbi:MAG: hypothetical protein EXR50_08170 [Dehalococcoidia bacterium]|nr:hypothetical protein [Dehalococcoidia bacterium]
MIWNRQFKKCLVLVGVAGLAVGLTACGGEAAPVATQAPVIQTVVVEKIVQQTVVVEKPVEKVVQQTVVVVQTATPTAPPAAKPTAAPAPAPQPKNPAGTIVLRMPSLGAQPGTNTIQGESFAPEWGLGERLFTWRFREDGSIDYEVPQIAVSWQVASDLSKATVQIRKGVLFHKGWGELTADDVAFSFNLANPSITPYAIGTSASVYASLFGKNPVKALDRYTVELPFLKYDVTWMGMVLSTGGRPGALMLSKRVFDEKGEEWMKENTVVTGPLQVGSWATADRAVLTPFLEHWSIKAQFKQIVVQAIPEESSALAAMQTGEVDAGFMSIRSVQQLVASGFKAVPTGNAIQASLYFSGNNWETRHALTGAPLDIAAMGVFANDLPWIGNPNTPNDANNPKGMNDMEQARLVRWALAMSIDRSTIIKKLTDGLAQPNYVAYIDPKSEYWQQKWFVPYDPALAAEYLDKAGFPKGKGGVRFIMPIYSDITNPLVMETADAVSGYFSAVGVETPVLKYPYSVHRPSVVGRTSVTPILYHDDDGNSIYPHDKPKGLVNSSLTRGGYCVCYEAAELADNYLKAAAEPDRKKRIVLADQFIDFVHYWALQPGVLAEPVFGTYNPNSIKEWKIQPAAKNISAFYAIIPTR